MYIIPSLKHNRFKDVDIPEASELAKRVIGYGTTYENKQASGEDFINPNASKLDTAVMVQKDITKAEDELDVKNEKE